MTTSFIGSSELWGDQAVARICQIVVEANDGMVQQILEGRHDWLDLLSKEELQRTDDLGLSLPFIAVYYDKPEAIVYLHKRGLDLSKPCDAVGFGTPMYYAITLNKLRLVEALNSIGYSITTPCETVFNKNAIYYAQKTDDPYVLQLLEQIRSREIRAFALLRKNYLKSVDRKHFLLKKRSITKIQNCIRAKLARIFFRKVKAGFDIDTLRAGFGNESSMAESSQMEMSTVAEEGEEGGDL
jgi:hypothetical protein